MDVDVNGHTMRRLRAEKLWDKWAKLFYIDGKTIEYIQDKYRRPDNKKYARAYIYQQMEKVKRKVINDHMFHG